MAICVLLVWNFTVAAVHIYMYLSIDYSIYICVIDFLSMLYLPCCTLILLLLFILILYILYHISSCIIDGYCVCGVCPLGLMQCSVIRYQHFRGKYADAVSVYLLVVVVYSGRSNNNKKQWYNNECNDNDFFLFLFILIIGVDWEWWAGGSLILYIDDIDEDDRS